MSLVTTSAEAVAQRRKALRALLLKPLLVAGADDETIRLVRKHAPELRDWLAQETGWRLQVDTDSVRLFKSAPENTDGTHPARDGRAKPPFGRRRYVLLCLALAVLERADAQITLGRLAEGVLNAVAEPDLADAGVSFTLGRRDERSDLVAVVRLLLDWGVLDRVAGEENAYLSDTGDVLYDVRRRVLAALLTGQRGPSTVTATGFERRLAALTEEPVPDTDDLRNRALRHRLTRRLLDDPVVYYDELSEDERAYLVGQRHAITRRVSEATGLVPEMRAEGVAMVDPDDELTDVRMPEQGTDGHLTLLVAAYLAGKAAPVTVDALLAHVRTLAVKHKGHWRKGVTEPGADAELLETALVKLRALRLVTVTPGEPPVIAPRPAIARYAVDPPTIRDRAKDKPR
ncbi:TIGR02678 family protein [Actinokineospora iranica]|uniref:TIGR02678 family protein n=1 Tax=Actinokineospora iranica TaxID=1271860 RepID=A0A1G6X5W0_9PSEU|nr:TIGR02678 family protein [Actinokineospora iranica]SDD73489.1 TIGR02678 family protein [Actinokineospora iranica]